MEIGFGDARYLIRLALESPDSNFIGLEISNYALDRARRTVNQSGIQNVRLIRARAFMFLWLVCENTSLQDIYVNFPDPWPKAAHKNRRLINTGFLDLVAARMVAGSKIRIATDDSAYASSIDRRMRKSPYFEDVEDGGVEITTKSSLRTKYELKALRDDRTCYYFKRRRNTLETHNEIPRLEVLNMPHVIISTPLPLMEIGHLYEPANYSTEDIHVRFVDFFHSVQYDQAVVDTYISEGELEQRVLLTIKGKSKDRFVINMRETGFPRPTPATHFALRCLAELIVALHAKAEILGHNLKLVSEEQ